MKILLFSGSLRKGSLNKKLLRVAEQILKEKHDVEVVDLKSLQIPVYDGDIEEVGIPEGVLSLGRAIQSASAIVIASPEYNAAMAGSLKNTIDWVSRIRPVPIEKKPIFLMGASPGAFGTIRALTSADAPFDTLGAYPYPSRFALPKAHEAFSESGDLIDGNIKKRLEQSLHSFIEFSLKISN